MPQGWALIALLWLAPFGQAAQLWRFSNPRPHGNNIYEMSFEHGVVWQVGDRGSIYTSRDLDTWFPHDSGTTKSLRGISFFKGDPVISGEGGVIVTRAPQSKFKALSLNTADWLEGVAASADVVVTVGDNGAIYSSNDTTNWTRRGNFSTWLRSVAFGADRFVCVGENGFLATSPDGVNWTKTSLNTTADLNKVAYLNDRFWVVGENGTVLTNNFRFTFSTVPLQMTVTNSLFAIAGNTNEVVLAGDGVVLMGNLQTGQFVQQADSGAETLAPVWPYYSALWDGRLFLLGGRTGMKVEGFRTNAAAAMGWYIDDQPTRSWLWSVTSATDFYVACGAEGTILSSLDGIDWTREAVPTNALSQILLGVGGNRDALLCVGSGGTILRSPNVFTNVVSTNANGQLTNGQASLFGVVWNEIPSPTTSDLQAVAASSNLFMIGGAGGLIYTSPDGRVWQKRTSGVTSYISGAAAWPGGFVAVGASGVILTSPNATTWTKKTLGTNWIYAVRYVAGQLVAVGEGGTILTSSDAVQWTPRASGITDWINDVTYASNTWYAVATAGTILTSRDAVNWTASPSITSKSLYGAATDGGQVVLAGVEGTIIRAQLAALTSPVNFLSFGSEGIFDLFLFGGVPDQKFVLEAAPDLSSPWTPLEELDFFNNTGTLIYQRLKDPYSANFYRTRVLPP